jgi:hypothetical protein
VNYPNGQSERGCCIRADEQSGCVTEHPPPGSFSPELALVDPAAAERDRRDLPDVVLTEDARPPRGEPSLPPLQRRRPTWVLGAVAAVAVAGAAVGIWLGSGASNETSTSSSPAGAAVRTIPDFVWVQAANAARYRIEFLRGGRVVLQRTTVAPRLHVVASALPPGRYRWRVWALDATGGRLGSALVDASVGIA